MRSMGVTEAMRRIDMGDTITSTVITMDTSTGVTRDILAIRMGDIMMMIGIRG